VRLRSPERVPFGLNRDEPLQRPAESRLPPAAKPLPEGR
jgi:hypothetical protein